VEGISGSGGEYGRESGLLFPTIKDCEEIGPHSRPVRRRAAALSGPHKRPQKPSSMFLWPHADRIHAAWPHDAAANCRGGPAALQFPPHHAAA